MSLKCFPIFEFLLKLGQYDDGDHDVDLVSVVNVRVGDHVVVALNVEADFVVVVVIVVQVIRDVGHHGEDVHGGCKKSHLSQTDSGGIGCEGGKLFLF